MCGESGEGVVRWREWSVVCGAGGVLCVVKMVSSV